MTARSDDDRAWLDEAASRLEEIARSLGDHGLASAQVSALAEEAAAISAQIGERLPGILRPERGGG